MKNAILLHGKPSRKEYYDPKMPSLSNAHWFPWLQKQLLVNGINTQTPEMPLSFNPDYELWSREFERYDISPETLLVGHSTGAGFLLRWLSENKDVRIEKLVLVAPYTGFGAKVPKDFFNFELDELLADRTNGVVIISSDNDMGHIIRTVNDLRNRLRGPKAKYKGFHGYGHFTLNDMKTEKFPELLDECIK